MPLNRARLETALVRAHEAGNAEHAKVLAGALRKLDASAPAGSGLSFAPQTQEAPSQVVTPPPPQRADGKEAIPPGEFIENQARQGMANLGTMSAWTLDKLYNLGPSGALDRAGLPEGSARPVSDMLGVPEGQDRSAYYTDAWGVRPNVTTESIPGRIAGRAAEYGIGGLPFAPIGPAAYGLGTLGAAGGDVAGEDIAGEAGRLPGALLGSFMTPQWVVKAIGIGAKSVASGTKSVFRAASETGRADLKAAVKGSETLQSATKLGDDALNQLAQSGAARRLALAMQSDPKSSQTVSAFDDYLNLVEGMTGTRPQVTLAEVLRHPDLLEGQRLLAQSNVARLNKAQAARHLNEQVLGDATKKAVGHADEPALVSGLARTVDDQAQVLQQRAGDLTQKLDDTMAPLRQTPDPATSGTRIRNLIDAERKGVKGQFDQKFDAFRQQYGPAEFDVAPLIGKVRELSRDIANQLDPVNHPAILRNIDDLAKRWSSGGQEAGTILGAGGRPLIPGQAPTGYTAQIDDVWKTLQELTSDISDLSTRVGAKPNVLRKLNETVDVILDDVLAQGAKSGLSDDAAAQLGRLRNEYRMDYINRFRLGQTRKIGVRDAAGDMSVTNEKVVEGYLKSDTNLGRLVAAIGDDADAMRLFDDAVVGMYAGRVSPNQAGLSTRAHHTFMQRHGAALKKHRPDLYEKIQNTGFTADDVGRSLKRIEIQQRDMIESQLVKRLQNDDIPAIVKDALRGPKSMADLLKSTPADQRENLRSVVLTRMLEDRPANKSVLDVISDQQAQKSLKILLGDQYGKTIRELKAISAVWEVMENPTTYRLTPSLYNEGRVKSFLREMGVPMPQIFSAGRAVGRRPGSGDWFLGIGAMQVSSAVATKRMGLQMEELQRMILADPKAREALLRSWQSGGMNMPNTSPLMNRIWTGVTVAAKNTAESAAIRTAIPAASMSNREQEEPATP